MNSTAHFGGHVGSRAAISIGALMSGPGACTRNQPVATPTSNQHKRNAPAVDRPRLRYDTLTEGIHHGASGWATPGTAALARKHCSLSAAVIPYSELGRWVGGALELALYQALLV
jgi:hypothetical protein